MPKPYRGKSLVGEPAHGRGTCPACARTRVKVLWEKNIDGQTVKVCKKCKAKAS